MRTRKPARVVCLRRLAWGVAIVGLYFTCCPTKQSLYESATLLWPCELGMEARSREGKHLRTANNCSLALSIPLTTTMAESDDWAVRVQASSHKRKSLTGSQFVSQSDRIRRSHHVSRRLLLIYTRSRRFLTGQERLPRTRHPETCSALAPTLARRYAAL